MLLWMCHWLVSFIFFYSFECSMAPSHIAPIAVTIIEQNASEEKIEAKYIVSVLYAQIISCGEMVFFFFSFLMQFCVCFYFIHYFLYFALINAKTSILQALLMCINVIVFFFSLCVEIRFRFFWLEKFIMLEVNSIYIAEIKNGLERITNASI